MTYEQPPQGGQQPQGQYPTQQQPGQYPQYPQGGAPQYGQPGYGYPVPQQQPGNGLAIAGMVCGIVGLLIANIILGPLAIIFGGIGWNRANNGAKYKGMAIAGVVLGVLDIVILVVVYALVLNRGFV